MSDVVDERSRAFALSEECARWLQSDAVNTYLVTAEAKLIDEMVRLEIDDETRRRAAVAVGVVRGMKRFMQKSAELKEFNWDQLQKALGSHEGDQSEA